MMGKFWSALTRFVACVVAILATFTFVVYGRTWLAAETRVAQEAKTAPAAKASAGEKEEAKTPIVRSMLEAMKNLDAGDGTDDERRFVREQLLQADDELSTSLGGNTRSVILKANNRHQAFRIPKGSSTRMPRRPSP